MCVFIVQLFLIVSAGDVYDYTGQRLDISEVS